MSTTGETVDLAEWIIDWLFSFVMYAMILLLLIRNSKSSFEKACNHVRKATIQKSQSKGQI